MSWVTRRIHPEDVVDPKTFATYAQQEIGTPYPNGKQLNQLRAVLKDTFEKNPKVTYATLCRVVDWLKSRRRRVPHAFLVPQHIRWAWQAGILPELDPSLDEPVNVNIEAAIEQALKVEQNAAWRSVLMGAVGEANRKEALHQWREYRNAKDAKR